MLRIAQSFTIPRGSKLLVIFAHETAKTQKKSAPAPPPRPPDPPPHPGHTWAGGFTPAPPQSQGLRSASDQECMPDSPKSRARQHVLPLVSRALEAHHSAPFEPSGAACAPLVDTSNTRISAAAQAPAGSSQWFSVLHRLFRVDLDHSAPRRRTSSVIMMVAPAPARRDHLALIGSSCTPPAGSCTAARQWGEQKHSIAQRKSAFSAAL